MISPMTTILIFFVLGYLYHGLGITLGYHRLLSHRAFKVPRWLEYFIVSGAYLAFEGAPIFWVTAHRIHHRYSDHKGDPHSPRDGFWHAWIAWMWDGMVPVSEEQNKLLSPDLYRDNVYKFLHAGGGGKDGLICLAFNFTYRAAIVLIFGWWALLGEFLGTLLAFTGPLMVNTFCHMRNLGYETYPCADDSRNVGFVGFLALGEGWHNNHHAFPQSARHGLTPKEPDLSWMFLSVLKAVGLATDVRLPKITKQSETTKAVERGTETHEVVPGVIHEVASEPAEIAK